MKLVSFLLLSILFVACNGNADLGKVVTDKGDKLYYVEPVTEAEAKDVLNWLHETNHNWGQPPVPFQLSKQGNKYVFKYAVQNEDMIESATGFIETFATKLSERLKGAPVDVHLMDAKLQTQKKVISSGK
jgi:hypothetical protein